MSDLQSTEKKQIAGKLVELSTKPGRSNFGGLFEQNMGMKSMFQFSASFSRAQFFFGPRSNINLSSLEGYESVDPPRCVVLDFFPRHWKLLDEDKMHSTRIC